jgi:hypothetical protein
MNSNSGNNNDQTKPYTLLLVMDLIISLALGFRAIAQQDFEAAPAAPIWNILHRNFGTCGRNTFLVRMEWWRHR